MEENRLEKQLNFLKDTDKLKQIDRRTVLMDASRRENDAEHSWHLALYAMILGEHARKDGLNMEKVLEMALVHDLVEIYAGDTFAYDAAGYEDKELREQKAADRLFSLLPEDQGSRIRSLWEEFDAMETPESLFAAALDRLQPFFHNVHTEGYTWKEGKVHSAQVLKRMDPIREALPDLWDFILKETQNGIEKGYLQE